MTTSAEFARQTAWGRFGIRAFQQSEMEVALNRPTMSANNVPQGASQPSEDRPFAAPILMPKRSLRLRVRFP